MKVIGSRSRTNCGKSFHIKEMKLNESAESQARSGDGVIVKENDDESDGND